MTGHTKAVHDALLITELGTVTVGTWNATDIDIEYLDEDLHDLLMLGSDNAAWVPCSFWTVNEFGYVDGTPTRIRNNAANNLNIGFNIPIPLTLGSYTLRIGRIKLDIYDADANDYVDTLTVFGMDYDSQATLYTNATNRTAQGQYTYNPSDFDTSGYTNIVVVLYCSNNTAADLKLVSVQVQVYYA